MSDTVLSFIVTVLLLAALSAWVPLLHLAGRLVKRRARRTARELPPSRKTTPAVGLDAGIAR